MSGASHDPYPLCQGGEARGGSDSEEAAALGAAPNLSAAEVAVAGEAVVDVSGVGSSASGPAAGVDGGREQLAHNAAPRVNASPPAFRTALANLSSPTPGLYASFV